MVRHLTSNKLQVYFEELGYSVENVDLFRTFKVMDSRVLFSAADSSSLGF